MSGWLRVVGVGPGPACWITREVSVLLAEASDVVGYQTYLARLSARPGQTLHGYLPRSELRCGAERPHHHTLAQLHRVWDLPRDLPQRQHFLEIPRGRVRGELPLRVTAIPPHTGD